jgi:hypothetical protein
MDRVQPSRWRSLLAIVARHARARMAAPFGVMIVVAATLLGCEPDPVMWDAQRVAVGGTDTGDVVSVDGTLHPDSMALLATRVAPPGDMCPGSLALSHAGTHLFAVWWAVRADSSARLLAARSDDGGVRWSAPAPVDTTDQAVSGCRRAPPAVSADSASGYIHVAYALTGPEGPGLFFSHSMDMGATFHSPVSIFYGERLGRVSVAADGDVVAVGFEDPNSTIPRVGLALSRTMGHIFEERIVPVSDDNGAASHPLVAVRRRRIAVAWERRAASDSATRLIAIRTGTLR